MTINISGRNILRVAERERLKAEVAAITSQIAERHVEQLRGLNAKDDLAVEEAS